MLPTANLNRNLIFAAFLNSPDIINMDALILEYLLYAKTHGFAVMFLFIQFGREGGLNCDFFSRFTCLIREISMPPPLKIKSYIRPLPTLRITMVNIYIIYVYVYIYLYKAWGSGYRLSGEMLYHETRWKLAGCPYHRIYLLSKGKKLKLLAQLYL